MADLEKTDPEKTPAGFLDALEKTVDLTSWRYGVHDCISVAAIIVYKYTGISIDRNDYIPEVARRSIVKAGRWCAGLPCIEAPVLDAFRQAGLKEVECDGHLIVVAGGQRPIELDDGTQYLVNMVPGVLFNPKAGELYCYSMRGLAPIDPLRLEDRRLYQFDLF